MQVNDDKIAVVGMAVRYTGANNKEEFWRALLSESRPNSSISDKRLGSDRRDIHLDPRRSKFADTFCNDTYGTIDNTPTTEHELLLELAKRALVDSGMMNQNGQSTSKNGSDLSRTGIISGCLSFPNDATQGELLDVYKETLDRILGDQHLGSNGTWPNTTSNGCVRPSNDLTPHTNPANYVAKKLGLGNEHYCIDAACASALYVLKLAQDSLLSGKTDVMLASATCLPEPFFILTGFSAFQALPLPGGDSTPLQQGTTGLTPGEGGSVMVLKRYADAVRDGDRIYGTLLGVRLDNAGTGLPLKPHQPSELRTLRDTYTNIGISPSTVSYVECHATGTVQGDLAEVDAICGVFSNGDGSGKNSQDGNNPLPLMGCTKGNFGHSLVAAGFAGMAKVLLSMKHQQIPATPGVTKPIHNNVITSITKWPKGDQSKPRRAGLSAFGFGGTNAHAVFEEYIPNSNSQRRAQNIQRIQDPSRSLVPSNRITPSTTGRVAVVGMAARFGAIQNLSEYERALYHGTTGATSLPEKRWRFLGDDPNFLSKLGLDKGAPPHGCFVDKVDVDFKRLKTPLVPEDQLIPQQLLALSTIDRAIIDSGMSKGGRVAVIVGLGTDMELYRHRARVTMRERFDSSISKDSQKNSMNYVNRVGTSTSYVSYIGNLVATRISSLWGFTGPAFTITEGSNSVYRCLDVARDMLLKGDIDAAVIGGVDLCGSAEALYVKTRRSKMSTNNEPTISLDQSNDGFFVGEGCGALVLRRLEECDDVGSPAARMSDMSEDTTSNNTKIYCTIDGIGCSTSVEIAANQAVKDANIHSNDIDYIEISADGEEELDFAELKGLAS